MLWKVKRRPLAVEIVAALMLRAAIAFAAVLTVEIVKALFWG